MASSPKGSSRVTGGVPIIFGLEGPQLTDGERFFFEATNPWGFILFRWNMETPEQIQNLIKKLKETVGREDVPILVDAEGGRVFRLPEAFYPKPPAFQVFGEIWRDDPEQALQACYKNAHDIGQTLHSLGFTVNCSPLLDLRVKGAHDVIGDRAFSTDPTIVGQLGAAVIRGLSDAGITPVIKHIPGHGAALTDSHDELPVVTLSHEALQPHLIPFQMNREAPWAMTAHIVYEAIDPTQPATFSSPVIQDIIRGEIGFKGILVSDDLYMKAVSGTPAEKVQRALNAGCDAVLYCRGGLEEWKRSVEINI